MHYVAYHNVVDYLAQRTFCTDRWHRFVHANKRMLDICVYIRIVVRVYCVNVEVGQSSSPLACRDLCKLTICQHGPRADRGGHQQVPPLVEHWTNAASQFLDAGLCVRIPCNHGQKGYTVLVNGSIYVINV